MLTINGARRAPVLVVVVATLLGTNAIDTDAVVRWADANCATGSSECAEFVSDALKAGGETTCWDTWVPNLVNCLAYYYKPAHYYQTSFPGPRGSVVVYYDSTSAYHVAISRGDGTTDQHNANHCGENGGWGNNYVLAAYGSEDFGEDFTTTNDSVAKARSMGLPMPKHLGMRSNRTRSGLPCAPDHEVCHDGLCCPIETKRQ